MATDATGTPTSPDNIPTYNTAGDPPSGKGFNAAMAAIQTALSKRLNISTLFTAVGDLAYASGVGVASRLGIGSAGQVLTVAGGVPTWAAASGTSTVVFDSGFLGAPAGTIDTGVMTIPASCTHLSFRWHGRGTDASARILGFYYNNDASANYDFRADGGGASAVQAFVANASTSVNLSFAVVPVGAGAGFSGSAEWRVLQPASTFFKCGSGRYGFYDNLAQGLFNMGFWHMYRTTAAITRVTVFPSLGNFAAGTRLVVVAES